jgi:histidine ammonia-lyase
MRRLLINDGTLTLSDARSFVFNRERWDGIEIHASAREKIERSHSKLYDILEKKIPVYGVTTGFGDSCGRTIPAESSELLQKNLTAYLLCGTGARISRAASKATCLFRLKSLSRGYSGVSLELIDRLKLYLENDWVPVIPREGSLGASGDLVPLAYISQALLGEGIVETLDGDRPIADLLKAVGLKPYRLKPKEGLALVNGTSVMAGLSLVHANSVRFLTELSAMATGWLVLALRGRTDAFGELVNQRAKSHVGQSLMAQRIEQVLNEENYHSTVQSSVSKEGLVQDRYSIRCTPQILGPVWDTLRMVESWIECEVNGTSDNPLIDGEGNLAMGGNFYGGYLGHGMDYLKISIAQMADLLDRQLITVIDEKSNRGLPPNLANWNGLPEDERFLHHGLKGLHQLVGAVTSEIMAKAIPNTIFSRSSESHNQDKVSLGMSAAVQCGDMLEPMFTISGVYLICLAQALDLRGVRLNGGLSRDFYDLVRSHVPFVERDTRLDTGILQLVDRLKSRAIDQGGVFSSYEKA